MKRLMTGFLAGAAAGLLAEAGLAIFGGVDSVWGWMPAVVCFGVFLVVLAIGRMR